MSSRADHSLCNKGGDIGRAEEARRVSHAQTPARMHGQHSDARAQIASL